MGTRDRKAKLAVLEKAYASTAGLSYMQTQITNSKTSMIHSDLSFINSVQRFFTARQVSLLHFFSSLRQNACEFCTRSNLPSQFSVA